METLLQANLYWMALYACYALFLRRQTFLHWNRAYLLGSLLAAFALPLVQYPEAAPAVPMVYEMSAAAFTVGATVAVPPPSLLTWENLLWLLYGIGVLVMLVRLVRHSRCLYFLIKSGDSIEMDGYTLILSEDDQTGSFSFLRWVVVSRSDYEHNFDTILTHELAHVRQRHSWDILLVEGLRVVFWFNPVLVLYKNALQQVHEYLADRQAEADNRDRYAEFLVSYALNTPSAVLTNQFFNPKLLKNRIAMLYKNKNSKWALGKYLAIAPLIVLVLALTAARERVVDVMDRDVQVLAPANGLVTELPGVLQAETTTVKGTVRSSKTKELLPGANVILAGTSRGVTTDANGAFELNEVPLDGKLAISYVGYETRVVEITKKNQVVNVVLEWKQNSLNNVVVVAYLPKVDSRTQPGIDSAKKGEEKQFMVVEQMPEFPGGSQEMYKFLARNIRYPTEAVRDDLEGKVVVTFTVSDKGRIRNPQVIQSLGGGTDEEALRVVLNMPSWKPAIQNRRPVAMEYVLTIEFQLDKSKLKEDKEKRQGQTTEQQSHTTGQGAKAFNFHMPDFKFEDAVDYGNSVYGSNTSTIRGMPMPNSIYSKQKFTEDFSSQQIIFFKDSVQPARFMNYRNPYIRSKN